MCLFGLQTFYFVQISMSKKIPYCSFQILMFKKTLYHVARSPINRGKRILVECDNMSCVMAFNKGRCQNLPLLILCRRVAAISLAFNMYPKWRYVESKRNRADAETRPDLLKPPIAFRPPPGLDPPDSAPHVTGQRSADELFKDLDAALGVSPTGRLFRNTHC